MKDNREFTPPSKTFKITFLFILRSHFLKKKKKEQNVSQVKDICRLKNVQVFPLQSQILCLIIQLPPASHPQLCFMSVLLNQTSQNNPVPLQIKKKQIHFIPNCFKSEIRTSFSHFFLNNPNIQNYICHHICTSYNLFISAPNPPFFSLLYNLLDLDSENFVSQLIVVRLC